MACSSDSGVLKVAVRAVRQKVNRKESNRDRTLAVLMELQIKIQREMEGWPGKGARRKGKHLEVNARDGMRSGSGGLAGHWGGGTLGKEKGEEGARLVEC